MGSAGPTHSLPAGYLKPVFGFIIRFRRRSRERRAHDFTVYFVYASCWNDFQRSRFRGMGALSDRHLLRKIYFPPLAPVLGRRCRLTQTAIGSGGCRRSSPWENSAGRSCSRRSASPLDAFSLGMAGLPSPMLASGTRYIVTVLLSLLLYRSPIIYRLARDRTVRRESVRR